MPQDNSANNKRIAKNTLLLYFRMLFMMVISLYTSRVILATLGVSDYGIYNVVGGFVAMFTMISGTMATATQRFLSFEIGKGTEEKITKLFSTSVMIHVLLGGVVLLFAETIGLWFVNHKMVFPEDRVFAVHWVYQFSVFTLIINVLSVPYNACIIAYEKMAAFAYISIVEAISKLLITYLVVMTSFDKLFFYSFLIMLIAIAIRILYVAYVNRHFKYCRCNWQIDKEYRNNMLSFIGFNFIGSIANILKTQGINVLLNLFFGPMVNAARGISVQVLHAVSGFVTNFQMALNPQIIKLYAAGEKEEMFKLIFRGSKISFLLMWIISLPIMVETPYILSLWLVEVPEHTVIFVRLTLAITIVDSMSHTLITGVHATGKVKKYQLINGTMLLMTLPLVYLILKLGYPPFMAFVVSLMISIVCHFIRLLVLSTLIELPVLSFLRAVTLRALVVSLISIIVPVCFLVIKEDTFPFFLISCIITLLSVLLCEYVWGLNHEEKNIVISEIKKRIIKTSYKSR